MVHAAAVKVKAKGGAGVSNGNLGRRCSGIGVQAEVRQTHGADANNNNKENSKGDKTLRLKRVLQLTAKNNQNQRKHMFRVLLQLRRQMLLMYRWG